MAPALIEADSDEGAELISDCQNVAPNYRVETFIIGDYLTTWDSAFAEGMQDGVREALEAPSARGTMGAKYINQLMNSQTGRAAAIERLHQSPAAKWKIRTTTLFNIPKPFCRRFNSRHDVVSMAVSDVLASLRGYKLLTNDTKWGLFETDFVEQRYGKKLRWRDRFVIMVDPDGPKSSIVRILRDIYINRSGVSFNQGISVGRNEAYILTRIDDTLATKWYLPAIPGRQ